MSTAVASLSGVDLDQIVERIANGEYQSHIAQELGIPSTSLYEHIARHPAYRLALKCRNAAKLDKAQHDLDTETEYARAREAFKAAAWRAERECPEEWGQRNQLIVANVSLDQLLGEAERQIEGEVGTAEVPQRTITEK